MGKISYLGVASNDPQEAVEIYKNRFGIDATVIVARPNFAVKENHPLLVRSRFGMPNGFLVTHLVSMIGRAHV